MNRERGGIHDRLLASDLDKLYLDGFVRQLAYEHVDFAYRVPTAWDDHQSWLLEQVVQRA